MSDYTPDRWEVVEIQSDGHDTLRKILGSWYGGYASSDSWRFSSGITRVADKDTYWEVENYSGSIYTCYKESQGMSAYTAGVFANMVEQGKDKGVSLTIVDIEKPVIGYL
jgi:hypothetical protein